MGDESEQHEEDCHCDLFSDLYKDVNGFRPRGEHWTCREVARWHAEHYAEVRPKYWVRRDDLEERIAEGGMVSRMKQKQMTYRELRDFLGKLDERQLDMPVTWLGDERGGFIGNVEVLAVDHVDFGEGLEPWAAYEGSGYEREDAVQYPAGTVVLHSDVYEWE